MHRIALINIKGGSGKTTIATCLAAYYADKGIKTSLTDYDLQSSSIGWLKRRDINKPTIYGIDATNRNKAMTLSWQLQPPADTEISILDTPAGITISELVRVIDRSDSLLIPVLPSQIDIQAAARFIEVLLLQGKIRGKNKNIGIIANRIHTNTLSYQALEKFLARLDIPLIAKFRSIQSYIHASDRGLGLHELATHQASKELKQWDNLIHWLDEHHSEKYPKTPLSLLG